MNSLIHADIFFFISTIALIVITVFVAVALFYVIKVFKTLHEASQIVKQKVSHIAGRIDDVENFIEESSVLHWIQSFTGRKKRSSRTSSQKGTN
jgi:hypothetical protein